MSTPARNDASTSGLSQAVFKAALSLDTSQSPSANVRGLLNALVESGWADGGAVWKRGSTSQAFHRIGMAGEADVPFSLPLGTHPDVQVVRLSPDVSFAPDALVPASGAALLVSVGGIGLWWLHRTLPQNAFSRSERRAVCRLADRLEPCLATAESLLSGSPFLDLASSDVTEAASDASTPSPLRVVESRFKTLMDSLQAAAVVFDAHGHVSYANEAAWELFDLSPDDIGYRNDGTPEESGMTVRDAVEVIYDRLADPDAFLDRIMTLLDEETPVHRERIDFANGTVTERSYAPVHTGGETVGHVFVYWDVTERHHTEHALRESEERWRRLVEKHPGPIYITVEGTFVYANPATADLFGADAPEDLIGRSVLDFAHPDVRDTIRERRDRLTHGRSATEPFEHQVVRLDGVTRIIIVRSVPVSYQGRPAAQTMVRDVTEQRETEAQLQHAKETAEEALRVKERFLSTVTHELRTPLHAVLGLTEQLGTTDLTDHQRDLLEDVHFSADSLLDILNDILDTSAMGAGRLELRPEPFSPADLARQLVDTMQEKAVSQGVELGLEVKDLPDALRGDALRIKQILWNLISNAITATDQGSVRVRLAPATPPNEQDESETADATPSNAEVYWLALAVSDTGPGLSEEDQARIFESFVQLGSSGERPSGTGLGLTIVRELARLHGGTVDVESSLGEGSTFVVRLPLPRASSSDETSIETTDGAPDAESITSRDRTRNRSQRAPSEASDARSGYGSVRPDDRPPDDLLAGLRVLLVEDTPSNRDLARHVLTSAGAEVTAVARGDEALRRLQENTYDCVLMDLQLPGIDGFETARRIRKELGRTDLPILALSASNPGSRSRDVSRSGMDGFLTKPFRAAELYQRIADVLENPPGRRAANPVGVGASGIGDASDGDDPSSSGLRPSDPVIDSTALSRNAHSYEVSIDDLREAFYEDAQAFEEAISDALAASDPEAVREACHDLKTSAHLVGASRLFDLLADVEARRRPVDAQTGALLRTHLHAARLALSQTEPDAP